MPSDLQKTRYKGGKTNQSLNIFYFTHSQIICVVPRLNKVCEWVMNVAYFEIFNFVKLKTLRVCIFAWKSFHYFLLLMPNAFSNSSCGAWIKPNCSFTKINPCEYFFRSRFAKLTPHDYLVTFLKDFPIF